MVTVLVFFYLVYFRNDPKAARSRIDALESPAGPAHLYLQILKWASQAGLQIRITNADPDLAFHFNADPHHFNVDRIRIQLITSM